MAVHRAELEIWRESQGEQSAGQLATRMHHVRIHIDGQTVRQSASRRMGNKMSLELFGSQSVSRRMENKMPLEFLGPQSGLVDAPVEWCLFDVQHPLPALYQLPTETQVSQFFLSGAGTMRRGTGQGRYQ